MDLGDKTLEVWHRIGFGSHNRVDKYLDELGVNYKKAPLPGSSYLLYFDISESDVRWLKIEELIKRHGASDMWDTIYTHQEIESAEWSRLSPVFEQGYPQPEDTFEWRDNAYNFVCGECGIAYGQKAPFYMRKEPRMGRKDFLSLYWTYALFCTFKVLPILQVNQIRGYETQDVYIWRTKQPSQLVKQLVITHVAAPGLRDEDKQEPEACNVCGLTKYSYHKRGYMHLDRSALAADFDIQMTNEWFGSGGRNAFREFLVSQRVAKLILEQGWRGVALKPVILV